MERVGILWVFLGVAVNGCCQTCADTVENFLLADPLWSRRWRASLLLISIMLIRKAFSSSTGQEVRIGGLGLFAAQHNEQARLPPWQFPCLQQRTGMPWKPPPPTQARAVFRGR
jgi:hypothetical protein